MVSGLGLLRRTIPTPATKDVSFAKLGLPGAASPWALRLESVPRWVVRGFEYGADSADQNEVVRNLHGIDPFYKGLAYEGATAAMMLRDFLSPGRTDHTARFVEGPGAPYALMAYIGMGFLMRRVPRGLWPRALPRLDKPGTLSQLTWLAVDGYAFDLAYFDPKRWIFGKRCPAPYPWEGDPGYFLRAFDQGVGRAMWFAYGGDCAEISRVITGFEQSRRADLWSGAGAAVGYLGGPGAGDVRALCESAGRYRPDLAVGAAIAIKARHASGYVPECTELAASVVWGRSVDQVAEWAESASLAAPTTGHTMPGYEQWRLRIRKQYCVDNVSSTGP